MVRQEENENCNIRTNEGLYFLPRNSSRALKYSIIFSISSGSQKFHSKEKKISLVDLSVV